MVNPTHASAGEMAAISVRLMAHPIPNTRMKKTDIK